MNAIAIHILEYDVYIKNVLRIHGGDCIEGIIHRMKWIEQTMHMFVQAELCTHESDAMGKTKTCMLCNVATRTALSFL